jgi:hypothetical protein
MKVTVELSEQEIAAAIDRAVEVNQTIKCERRAEYIYVWSHTDDETRYLVTLVDGRSVSCSCPSFVYRRGGGNGLYVAGECKHMREVDAGNGFNQPR